MSINHNQSESDETKREVTHLVQEYFDLLYTSDLELFDRVFDGQAQLYGLADGAPVVWPAAKYRAIIKGRDSPQALGAKRRRNPSDRLRICNAGLREGEGPHQQHGVHRLFDRSPPHPRLADSFQDLPSPAGLDTQSCFSQAFKEMTTTRNLLWS
jgi:Putative lumazine-binding